MQARRLRYVTATSIGRKPSTKRRRRLSRATAMFYICCCFRSGTPVSPEQPLPYSAIIDRKPLKLPRGVRLVVWPIVNVEVWDIERPMPRQALPPPTGVTRLPDVPHWAWHEYGNRVGFWRLKAALDRLKITPSLSVNARVCED